MDRSATQRAPLRFATVGSVDDGKSTLIGRLLHDSKSIFEDQLEHIEAVSKRRGTDYVDLALLTDGLRAEREQGITIDVAYRYFSTPHRDFVIADCPGHVQYTRNAITGASTADLAIVLVDARHGVVEQTRRHSLLVSLLGVPHLVICVNKMDLVDHAEDRFDEIRDEFTEFAARLDLRDVTFIPISALDGDNVVDRSANMPWYEGPTLLHHLETVYTASDDNLIDVRFPVQYVIRPQRAEHRDYRGYAGTVAAGTLRPGDEVMVLPSGLTSRDRAHRHRRRPGRRGPPVDGRDAAAGRRPRHLPRRHDLPAAQPPDAVAGPRRDGGLDGLRRTRWRCARCTRSSTRPARCGRWSPTCATASTSARCTATPTASQLDAQRDRPGHAAGDGAAVRRRLPPQPGHRQLRPDRRGDQPDRRPPACSARLSRRDGTQRDAVFWHDADGRARRPLVGDRPGRGDGVVHRAVGLGQVDASPTPSPTALLDAGRAVVRARRRQRPPRAQRRPRLLRRRPRPRTSAASARSPA